MRSIAIVGSGIVGLIAAHALRREGNRVTLYSDRTAEQWLNESRPTGTAARFEMALQIERELGLNHWDDAAPRGEGVFFTYCPK
ncbi:MAG TPA: NAD(P)-binding protein, partial [Thermoanaerobaculia bacterium]